MITPGKRNYILLSLFDFLYLFAWSSTMAFFVIWTTQHLGISATKNRPAVLRQRLHCSVDAAFFWLYCR
ncbi:sucrose permease [Raoultella ornithinolytica]|nr:sucrose permease [Raoultella ornithinolytica]